MAIYDMANAKFLSAVSDPDPNFRKLVGHAALLDSLSMMLDTGSTEDDSPLCSEHRSQDVTDDEGSEEEDEYATDSDSESSTSSDTDDSDGEWRREVELVDIVELGCGPSGGETTATALPTDSENHGRVESVQCECEFPPLLEHTSHYRLSA